MNRAPEKAEKVDLSRLDEITENLQSALKRNSDVYRNTVLGIAGALNSFSRGSMTKIDVDELRDQIGHLLYFHIKDLKYPVPFDVEFLPPLRAHFKNPAVIVLRRIRKYLMAAHRKMLAKLEEEQALERRVDFASLDINTQVRKGLEEIQRIQTLAKLAKTVSRKLDILTKALHVPAQFHSRFRLIRRLLTDEHHLRYREGREWLNNSSFKGNVKLLHGLMDKGLELLDTKSREIFDEMERISGIPFDRDMTEMDSGFNWYSLGTPLRRGEDFVRIFENEERVESKLKRLTFFMLRSSWDADYFRGIKEKWEPNPRRLQECCTNLARLYFDVEAKIQESTKPDGEAQTAIRGDVETGALNEKEAQEALGWVLQNRARLHQLKLEIFNTLAEVRSDNKDIALPEKLEELLALEHRAEPVGDRPPMPKISILDLHRRHEETDDQMSHPNSDLLAQLCALRKDLMDRKATMEDVNFQQQVRHSCAGFEEYEARLLDLNKAEARLDEMRVACEDNILECFREVEYDPDRYDSLTQAFEVVVDKMLYGIKTLDYSVIDSGRFADFFDRALALEDQQALYHLDWLLHEIHIIPRQDQLMNALADWENSLGKGPYEEKQNFILENEMKLQKLVDDVRAELRERITKAKMRPRRLRFEVFGLADSYAGNLRSLLDGLLRMAPGVASENEGERLISNMQAIESQVIEAQRTTKPKGEAYEKLAELERMKLLPPEVISELHIDLEENFNDLDALLHDANKGLERLRALQNRFGGEHDTSHLSITINIHDLESLKSIYNFVDNITIMDMKRFGVVYKHRHSMMEEIYDLAAKKDPSVPPEVAREISSKVYKQFKQKKYVPLSLKTVILKECPSILDFEIQLLIRTLNFVSSAYIREKAVYRGILKIMEQVKDANLSRRRMLRRIWTKFRSEMLAFKPRNYQANYQNNSRALITDVRTLVGTKFDDL